MNFTVQKDKPTIPLPRFPRLMQLKNEMEEEGVTVVLFTSEDQGFPLRHEGFGPAERGWLPQQHWEPFVGTIKVEA